ncbi:MAG: general secretion pathway protein GspK [Magnetococcales bacterium]|nr:general secretion pathway protein GspK [Magnetococcales bacterium]
MIPRHGRAGERGMVLLVTLAAIAFLVPLVYAGLESQRFQMRQVQRELELEMAHRHAQSLLTWVVAILAIDGMQGGMVDHPREPWAMPITLPDNPDGEAEAMVEDGGRRWNLNALRKEDGHLNLELRVILTRLASREGISTHLIERLVERLVPLDTAPGGGSAPGMAPEPLHDLEELLLLPDWNREALGKLAPFVSVDEACKNSRLNLNTASLKVLEPLAPEMNWRGVVEQRMKTPISQVNDLAAMGVTIPTEMLNLVTTGASCFSARIRSRVGGSAALLNAHLTRTGPKVTVSRVGWDG